MTPPQLPSTFGQNINADMKLLWPNKNLELEYSTDDYLTYYVDILELCGDPCGPEREWYAPFLPDCTGGSSYEDATRKLHKKIKDALLKKFGAKEAAGGDQRDS